MSTIELARSSNPRECWAQLPAGSRGFLAPGDILGSAPSQLRDLCKKVREDRESFVPGWDRAHGATTLPRRVLDFGCGFGFESLRFANIAQHIMISDIRRDTLNAATLVHAAHAGRVPDQHLHDPDRPECLAGLAGIGFDLIVMSGVLHHIPQPRPVIDRLAAALARGGVIRAMVYTDVSWQAITGRPLDRETPINKQDGFTEFVCHHDPVGSWADWYDPDKLAAVSGLDVISFDYLRDDRYYAMAVMGRPR